MKRATSLLLLILVLSCALLMIASCGGEEEDVTTTSPQNANKQVPVYQGMTISAATETVKAYLGGKEEFDYGKDNGNHNGHFKGDYVGKDEEIDEEAPFPENGKDETVEEEIKSSLTVVGSPETIYYATPGEEIYINIHIDIDKAHVKSLRLTQLP